MRTIQLSALALSFCFTTPEARPIHPTGKKFLVPQREYSRKISKKTQETKQDKAQADWDLKLLRLEKHAKARETVSVYQITSNFAPTKRLVWKRKDPKVLVFQPFLQLPSDEWIDQKFQNQERPAFPLFCLSQFLEEIEHYQKQTDGELKTIYQGSNKTLFKTVKLDEKRRSGTFRVHNDLIIKETYFRNPKKELRPATQLIRWSFIHEHVPYLLSWKLDFDAFGFFPEDTGVVRQLVPRPGSKVNPERLAAFRVKQESHMKMKQSVSPYDPRDYITDNPNSDYGPAYTRDGMGKLIRREY